MCVIEKKRKYLTEKHYRHESGTATSKAGLLAAAVALQGHTACFAEIVASLPPETMPQLTGLCKPPFLTLVDLPILVHEAARNTVHEHHGSIDPEYDVMLNTANMIAHVLRHTDIAKSKRKGEIQGLLLKAILTAKNDKDKSIQLALMIAGVKKYIVKCREDLNGQIAVTTVNSILGGLSAIPLFGAIPAALGPWFVYVLEKIKGKRSKLWKDLEQHVIDTFGRVSTQIQLHGSATLIDEHGTKHIIKIDKITFEKYCVNFFNRLIMN
jgi:hypothetical protein